MIGRRGEHPDLDSRTKTEAGMAAIPVPGLALALIAGLFFSTLQIPGPGSSAAVLGTLEAQSTEKAYATAPRVSEPYREAAAAARELIEEFLEESRAPGLSVAVGVEGEVVWSEGFGYADLEHRVPVTPLTRFRSGSIAKPMTAAAMARLHEAGVLDLDRPVREYVEAWPERHPPITSRQLAGHLAGIRHYPPEGDEFLMKVRFTDVVESLEIFKDDPLLFEPGEDYSYSSYGWNLLSAVIQEAAGRDYLQVMREEVWGPLEMRGTLGDHTDSIIPHRTAFYERVGGEPSYRTRPEGWGEGEPGAVWNAPYVDNSYKYAGGGMLTRPEDLVRFGSAHMKPGYLREETLAEWHTSQRTADGEETGYGIGWSVGEDEAGRRTVGHGGGSVGGTSDLLLYPGEGVVVAIQCNLTNAGYGDLTRRIAESFLDARRTATR